ncbi:MAG TPA: permease, partial [bacterium]
IVWSFFPPDRVRGLFMGRGKGVGYLLAVLMGVLTPFCSCSAVPLFIGFVTADIPLGITFTFLVAAPMVNAVALVLLFGLLGWKVAVVYFVTGLAVALGTGLVIDLLNMENQVEPWVYKVLATRSVAKKRLTWSERIQVGKDSVREIVGQIWLYVLAGILVGAGIQGFVPQNLMAALMGKSAWWSVPASVLIGMPMYLNSAGIIPLLQALLSKGAALGTALAFMMSVTALSLPELVILRKVLKPGLIVVFFAVVAFGILGVGYLLNWLF